MQSAGPGLRSKRQLRVRWKQRKRQVLAPGGNGLIVACSGRGSEVVDCGPVPGQELVDAVYRVVGDTGEDVAEIGEGIDAVQLACIDQAVDDGGALTSVVGTGEQPVLAAEGDTPERILGAVIVDLQAVILSIAGQRHPVAQGIAESLGEPPFGGSFASWASSQARNASIRGPASRRCARGRFCGASIGAVRERHRLDARKPSVSGGYARRTSGGGRGSGVSPGSLLQNQLVQGQVGGGTEKIGKTDFKHDGGRLKQLVRLSILGRK